MLRVRLRVRLEQIVLLVASSDFIVAPRRGAEVEMIDRADIGSDSHGSHSKATPVLT